LKKDYMTDAVFEVRCERPQEALGLLAAAAGIKEAALFGLGLHVIAEGELPIQETIRGALTAGGLAVSRIEKIVPSLEDVFVSLIEARDRAGQRPAGGSA
jgi:ABC-2 type transport system ATP-binding protein